ncbi:MAG: hypothetical protein M3140_01655 [Actinomycetota bacterium]|nr:hypothetical protein [Actinomycetota bacterium]
MSAVERASEHGGIEVHGQHQPVQHERPEDWGWHAELGGMARLGGWFSLVFLAVGLTATKYNNAGTVAIVACMVFIALGLLVDRQRRRTSWRR